MNNIKTKCYILCGTLFCFAAVISITSMRSVKADTSTTFPIDEAGIAAYVKLDSVDITDLTEALNFYDSIEKQEETYVIGTMKTHSTPPNYSSYDSSWINYPHLYIGLDGWIVAYYLKDQEASRIMQWKDYTSGTIDTTTLKDAIDIMCSNIGVSYSTDVKYYDFEFPEANKLTIVAETGSSNSFSITIPGILYEGSYSAYTGAMRVGIYVNSSYPLYLFVNKIKVFQSPTSSLRRYHDYYDVSTHLKTGIPHYIEFSRNNGGGVATVLVYKN